MIPGLLGPRLMRPVARFRAEAAMHGLGAALARTARWAARKLGSRGTPPTP